MPCVVTPSADIATTSPRRREWACFPCRVGGPTKIGLVDTRSDWVENIVQDPRYEWTRTGRYRVDAMVATGVPCQVAVGEKNGQPVLYVTVGHNCTVHYWQWASVNHRTRDPLPRQEAFNETWLFIEDAVRRTRSEVVPQLRGWDRAPI